MPILTLLPISSIFVKNSNANGTLVLLRVNMRVPEVWSNVVKSKEHDFTLMYSQCVETSKNNKPDK